VSRREFRTPIDVARPAAAFGMGAAATATLAITGEIALPVLAIGGGAVALAALARERPLALQRNGLLLNALLAASAALGIAMWVRGAYSTVALAHFAILTQALQLLDARPRKSEFLLVALALFQVVLAANLTDSLLFPPLLVIFAVSAVWTLMVHTLRAEAIEAGEPQAARRALTRSLFTMTGVASLATILIAVAIFPILPRVRSGALLSGGFGAGLGLSGFSDRVALGDLGRIRLDPSTALRVDTLEGPPPRPESAYWRGLSFDAFDGHAWSVTPDSREFVIGSSEMGVAVGAAPNGPRLVQRIIREPVISGVLFSAGRVLRLRGSVGRVERDANGGLYAFPTAGERVAYVATSAIDAPTEAMLGADHAEVPRETGERFLQLPALSPRVGALAREVTSGLATDAARARAIERHLRQAGRYTDSPPAHGSETVSPVESFLLDRTEGHCEYFASAMVVLLRSIGIPARLVNGFAGGQPNQILGFTELRQADAHTWVEVHYADAGWVRYDPTPPDLRLAGAHALAAHDRFAELQSALEFWWFRNVIDFDRSRQAAALRGLWQAWREWRDPQGSAAPRETEKREQKPGDLPAPPLAWLALPLAAFFAIQAWRQRRARRTAEPVPHYYVKALRLVARRGGARRASGDTARDFARRAAEELAAEPAAAFAALTELYLAERFGGRPAAEAGPAALVRLRDSLRA
jgi:transglutaminase-like putative cysteine protease